MDSRITTALILFAYIFDVNMAAPQQEEGLGFLSFDTAPPKRVSCPNMRVVSNFNLEQYMGRWFELERFDIPFQNGDCGTVDYRFGQNGTFTLFTTAVNKGKPTITEGKAVPYGGIGNARFYVTLPGIPKGDGTPNYNVVATDYKNFAVIYSCVNLGFSDKLEFAWIMSRREKLPEKILIVIKKWIQELGIDTKNFIKINQTNCIRPPPQMYERP